MLDEGEQPIDLEEVTVTIAPQPSRLHVFTSLAQAVHTHVSYMWGSFRRILTPVCDRSPRIEKSAPSMPQDTIRGQLNKGWVPLSEHLPKDYDEVLTQDWLHCLETTIAHALAMRSTSLPNCLPLLQEVENDIHTCIQLTSAQSDAMAWNTVLGTYAVLASHINNLTSRPARRGLFPEPASTSTPQPLPPSPPTPLHPLPIPPSQQPSPYPPPLHRSLPLFHLHPLQCHPSTSNPPSATAPSLITPSTSNLTPAAPPTHTPHHIPLLLITVTHTSLLHQHSPHLLPPNHQPAPTRHPHLVTTTPTPPLLPRRLQSHHPPMFLSLTLTITACNISNVKCSVLYRPSTLLILTNSLDG